MMLGLTGCSSNENTTIPVNENQGTIDYYGIQVPYVPLEDKDMPEWLIELKSKLVPYQIFVGTYNNEIVYHLNFGFDSSILGRFYDENGKPIDLKILNIDDLKNFLVHYRDIKCIYYKKVSSL